MRWATSWTSTESSTQAGTVWSRCEILMRRDAWEHDPHRADWFVTQRTEAGRAPDQVAVAQRDGAAEEPVVAQGGLRAVPCQEAPDEPVDRPAGGRRC